MFELRPYSNRHNNHIAAYDPFEAMREFERRFLDDDFMNTSAGEFRTDIKDNGDSYLLEADLPGVDKKDISININNDYLTVSAQRHSEHEESDKKNKYVRCERSYGSYSRSFDISNINADDIKAKYEDGVLRLTLPKKAETSPKSKQIDIE